MMYCQKCNRLLKDDNNICDKCGFDNNETSQKKKLKDIKATTDKKNPSKTTLTILFLCLLVIGLTTALIIYENKNKDDLEEKIFDTSNVEDYTNTFKYKDLEVKYPDTWGSSTGTIFYKDYAKINITFKSLTNDEYKEVLDINECLDYEINSIKTKTYATDISYSYALETNNNYYLITVNYSNNNNMFDNNIRKEVSNILSTLHTN